MPISRVRTVMTGVGGSPYYSNIYFANDPGNNDSTVQIGKVRTFWDAIRAHMVSGLQINIEAEVPLIDERTGQMTAVHVGNAQTVVGSGVGELLPLSNQALVQLFTAGFVNGRKVRGRIFIPAMLESNNSGGVPTPTLDNALQTAATVLVTGSPPVTVWSRPLKDKVTGAIIRDGSNYTALSANVWSAWAVLRSRRD